MTVIGESTCERFHDSATCGKPRQGGREGKREGGNDVGREEGRKERRKGEKKEERMEERMHCRPHSCHGPAVNSPIPPLYQSSASSAPSPLLQVMRVCIICLLLCVSSGFLSLSSPSCNCSIFSFLLLTCVRLPSHAKQTDHSNLFVT